MAGLLKDIYGFLWFASINDFSARILFGCGFRSLGRKNNGFLGVVLQAFFIFEYFRAIAAPMSF